MDFAFTEQQEMIRKEVGAPARSFFLDYWLEKDRKAEYPVEFIEAFARNGWLGIIVPEEYGGSGLGVTEASILLHEICAAGFYKIAPVSQQMALNYLSEHVLGLPKSY